MILRLTRQELSRLEKAVEKTYPIEACALLFGRIGQKKAAIEQIIVTPNILQSATRFEIHPKTFYDAFKRAKENGLEFLGFFHSHPMAVTPSRVDLKFMRLWGDAVWLVYSSTQRRFAAFQMRKGKMCTLTLEVEGKD